MTLWTGSRTKLTYIGCNIKHNSRSFGLGLLKEVGGGPGFGAQHQKSVKSAFSCSSCLREVELREIEEVDVLHVRVRLCAVVHQDVPVVPPRLQIGQVGVLRPPLRLNLAAVGEAVEAVGDGQPVDQAPDHLAADLRHAVED